MKIKRQKEVVIIVGSIFILSVLWIGFNLWHNAVTSTISQPLNEDIKDISPNFNTTIIQALKTRKYVDPLYSLSGQKQESSTTAASLEPTASAAAQITPAKASPSGQTKLEIP